MKYPYKILIAILIFSTPFICGAQTGPWAKYDENMKGEALVREADGGNLSEIKSILAGGGNVNYTISPSGLTPLMAAASGNHPEAVQLLILNGANMDVKDANGRTAFDRAKLVQAKDVMAVLKNEKNKTSSTPEEKKQLPVAALVTKNQTSIAKTNRNGTKGNWAPYGSFAVGEKVSFFNGDWHTGTIAEIGTPGDYSKKNIVTAERQYLISREGAPNWNERINWGNVTGLKREAYWTDFFIGNWRLGETMAVNTRTEGSYQHDEYDFHSAVDVLQVNANQTFIWKTRDKKTINGKWIAASDGAGIILIKAYREKDWTLRNETNAAEENIRGLQSARLTTAGIMSITAKRPL